MNTNQFLTDEPPKTKPSQESNFLVLENFVTKKQLLPPKPPKSVLLEAPKPKTMVNFTSMIAREVRLRKTAFNGYQNPRLSDTSLSRNATQCLREIVVTAPRTNSNIRDFKLVGTNQF